MALFASLRCCYLIAMFGGLLRRDPFRAEAARLYGVLAEQARQPAFFAEIGVPDTVDGRFDLLSLHVGLAIERLKQESDGVALSQSLFDAMFRHLDLTLREMGVQDLGVGKRIKIMAEGFHGRGLALREALAGDDAALEAVLARNVLSVQQPPTGSATRLRDYVRQLVAAFSATSRSQMLAANLRFPPI